jgi:site-specific DNA-methyltransferase (adenine-specific)
MREWLRAEWRRTGLPLSKTNEAAGVKNAATRKYFTACHLWYFPPPETMERIAFYARRHGKRTSHPYFSLDGRSQLTAERWAKMRAKWHHEHGVTNVWDEPPVHGRNRIRDEAGKYTHANQKPLRLIERAIRASSDKNDVVWDPFAGLATGAIAAHNEGRRYFGAEIDPNMHRAAVRRLAEHGVEVKTVGTHDKPRTDRRRVRARGSNAPVSLGRRAAAAG